MEKDQNQISIVEKQNSSTLTELHKNNNGKVSNKWTSYLPFYDNLFKLIKDKPIKLLEIGVQNGGSLETWSKYFRNAITISGCDIDEKCRFLKFEDSRISIEIGDANSNETFAKIAGRGDYDIVIDDGSHLSEDILIGFLNYFPLVSPGGVYIIEDTHAIYQRTATGINNKKNALCFFKDLTDVINNQFWSADVKIDDLLEGYLNVNLPKWINEGWIESIEFRNSIVKIVKSNVAGHNKLGQMTITGNIADVDEEPLKVKNYLMALPLN